MTLVPPPGRMRMLVASIIIALLVVGNIWRWSQPGDETTMTESQTSTAGLDLPRLEAAQNLVGTEREPARDPFLRPAAISTDPPSPPRPQRQASTPDELDVARERARLVFDAISVEGVLSTANGLRAVIRYDGDAGTFAERSDLVPGYTIKYISLIQLEIVNSDLGISRTYRVGE